MGRKVWLIVGSVVVIVVVIVVVFAMSGKDSGPKIQALGLHDDTSVYDESGRADGPGEHVLTSIDKGEYTDLDCQQMIDGSLWYHRADDGWLRAKDVAVDSSVKQLDDCG